MTRFARRTGIAALLYALCFRVLFAHAEEKDVERGRALYLEYCARCHGQAGVGDGPDAAPLEVRPKDFRHGDFLSTHADDELISRIRNGLPLLPSLHVTPTTPDTEALYGFLRNLPSIRWSLVDSGRATYSLSCSPCHGPYGHGDGFALGDGTYGPRDLSDPAFQRNTSDPDLEILVRHAKPGMRALDPPVAPEQGVPLRSFVRLLSPGYELYYRYCVSCHGPHGSAGEKQAGRRPRIIFDERYFEKNPYPDQVRERIWHMLEGARPPMPHFEATLTPDQVKAILTYLRSLPPLP
jgi:mono/diheme cytochrome c family protein